VSESKTTALADPGDLLEYLDEGVLALDAEGLLVYANQFAMSVYGFPEPPASLADAVGGEVAADWVGLVERAGEELTHAADVLGPSERRVRGLPRPVPAGAGWLGVR